MTAFLFANTPVPGHIAPFLPLARTLVERGHTVHWYTGETFRARIEATGARFWPIVNGLDYGDADYDRHFPERRQHSGLNQVKFDFRHLFFDAIEGHVTDLRAIIRAEAPDVLVTDPTVGAAYVLQNEDQVVWAMLNVSVAALYSLDVPPFGLGVLPMPGPLGRLRNQLLYFAAGNIVLRDLKTYLDAIITRNGWKPFSVIVKPTGSRCLNLMQSPPSLEYPIGDLDPTAHFVGPLLPPAPADFAPPTWWERVVNAGRPVVLVTQGTIATNPEELLIPSLEALKDLDVLVIGTTGGRTAEALGLHVPENAIVTPFIPFAYLMPHVDVMVTNGGLGGVNIALAHGVPLVAGGITEDKTEVNNRVAYNGVGINLKTATPTPAQIRAAVERVLGDAGFAERAAVIQAEIAAADAANTTADLLERLAKDRRPLSWALPESLRMRGWGQRRAG